MQLLLEGHVIVGFVDGSTPCPAQYIDTASDDSEVNSSSTCNVSDDFTIWKMHDKALMQLITATFSSGALSCAIGSTSSKDLCTWLKEQFFTVTRTKHLSNEV